jgi:hypothetical protein
MSKRYQFDSALSILKPPKISATWRSRLCFVALILASLLFVITPHAGWTQTNDFTTTDRQEEVTPTSSVDTEAKSSILSFPSNIQLPIRISTGVIVEDISSVNEQLEQFTAGVKLRLKWNDPRLVFDRSTVGSDRIEFGHESAQRKLKTIWTPKIKVDNLVGDPTREEPGLFIFSDGSVIYTQRLRGVFATKFDLSRFPFDTQKLEIVLTSPEYSAAQVLLVHEDVDRAFSGVQQGVGLPNWRFNWSFNNVNFIASQFRGWNGDAFSRMTAQITAERSAIKYMPSIFIPIFVILFLPLLAIWIGTDLSGRIGWILTGLFSLIALDFSTALQYPALDVDSAIIQLFWIGYVLQWSVLLLILIIFNKDLAYKIFDKYVIDEFVAFLIWGVPVILLVSVCNVLFSVSF